MNKLCKVGSPPSEVLKEGNDINDRVVAIFCDPTEFEKEMFCNCYEMVDLIVEVKGFLNGRVKSPQGERVLSRIDGILRTLKVRV